MKKVIIKLICFAVLAAVALSLAGCLDDDSPTYYDENGIGFRYRSVLVIPFDASGESAEVTIIDEYKKGGQTIQVVETTYGRDLCELIPKCENANASNFFNEYFAKKTLKEEKTFDLYFYIGKNMNSIRIWHNSYSNCFYKEIDDDSYIKYNINIIWDVSPDNSVYYSENGKLYYKNNSSRYKQGQLVPWT